LAFRAKTFRPEISTISIMVILALLQILLRGLRCNVLSHQSIARISSPYWYCRTSLKVIPRPLKEVCIPLKRYDHSIFGF
jgi:hypothetical protein